MALAVASYSSTGGSAAKDTSLTITAPSSIAEGDLLLATIGMIEVGGSETAPSGWTQLLSSASTIINNARGLKLYYKIATSADEAAANYTWTHSGSFLVAGAIMRVTGWGTANPLYDSDKHNYNGAGGSSTASWTGLTILKPAGALFINARCGTNEDGASSSNYQITDSGSNPTWTEVIDCTFNGGAGAEEDYEFHTAFAVTTDTSTLTGWGYDYSSSGSISDFLAVIAEPNNATGTFTHLSTSPTFPDPVSTSGVTGTHSSLSVTPTLNKPSASGRSKTWTTTNKS